MMYAPDAAQQNAPKAISALDTTAGSETLWSNKTGTNTRRFLTHWWILRASASANHWDLAGVLRSSVVVAALSDPLTGSHGAWSAAESSRWTGASPTTGPAPRAVRFPWL